MPNIKVYNRNKAVSYAKKWAYGRNPKYYDFSNLGGDCTNFASQCLYAGSGAMNYTPIYGWYYRNLNTRSASWSGVEYLYNFLVTNKGVGVFGKQVQISDIFIGDLIQLGDAEGDFYHSLIVTETGAVPNVDNILVSTHTFNAYNRPLNSYQYEKFRLIHIEGFRT